MGPIQLRRFNELQIEKFFSFPEWDERILQNIDNNLALAIGKNKIISIDDPKENHRSKRLKMKHILQQCSDIARRKNPGKNHCACKIHFSFVIQNGQIVKWPTNKNAIPTKHKDRAQIHSETGSLRKAKFLLMRKKPFDIINIRLNRQGALRMSKPCKKCLLLLKMVGCRTVHYSTDNGFVSMRI